MGGRHLAVWLALWLNLISAGLRPLSAQSPAPGVTLTPVAPGYAFEYLNAASFTRHNLYTVGNTQYIAFYNVNTNVTVGWRLLMQTNNLANGISANTNDWGTVSGSASTNQINLLINPNQPAEFYRLFFP